MVKIRTQRYGTDTVLEQAGALPTKPPITEIICKIFSSVTLMQYAILLNMKLIKCGSFFMF